MKTLIFLSLLTLSFSSLAGCLNDIEQKRLGELLILEDLAIESNPDCRIGTGANACLSPYNEKIKSFLEDKLKACASNQ